MLDTSVEFTGVKEAREAFGDKIFNDSLRGTINKVAAQARTHISRSIRETYNVKASAVNRELRVERATTKQADAFLFATGARIPLRDFGARRTRRGVSVRIRRDRPRMKLEGRPGFGFFISDEIGGHVFRRGGAKRPARRGRYRGTNILRQPISKRIGPGIPNMLRGRDMVSELQQFSQDNTLRIFGQELDFRIGRIIERSRRAAAQQAVR